jgi:HK97 family phage portal protein
VRSLTTLGNITPDGFSERKALFTPPRAMLGGGILPGTNVNYQARVGKGFGSSVVMAPVQWIARTFPQALLSVEMREEAVPEHPLTQLVNTPNPFYGGTALLMSTILSYTMSGNAYWLIVRDSRLRPIELWYAPHWLMTPVGGDSGENFITRYDYRPRGVAIPLDPADVIHFRYGLDPQDVRLGLSPLASLWREIATDDEAANFTAAILHNMGMAGTVIAPAAGKTVSPSDLETTKKYIDERYRGDQRGKAIVMSGATEVHQMGFNPQQLQLGAIRDVPEERVCAVLGIPAAVVGFGTGLQQTKVGATMREMVRLAWTANLIPMGRGFASEIQRCLLKEFEPRPEQGRVFFDVTDVEALQDDANERVERHAKLFTAGIITREEAKLATGFEPRPGDDIYLVSQNMIEWPAGSRKSADMRLLTAKGGQPTNGAIKGEPPFHPPLNPPPRRRLNQSQQRLRARLAREHNTLSGPFAADLEKVFDRLGKNVASAAREVLGTKDSHDDVDAIMLLVAMVSTQADFAAVGSAHWLRTAKSTFEGINIELGLSIGMPDTIANEILAAGGRHMGLVDLDKQTRLNLFKILEQAREEGLGVDVIARRIRDEIPAGRYKSAKIRARLIARTEAKHAQRTSTIEAYKASGVVEKVIVIDDRLGFGDEDCTFWANREVTLAEAVELGNQEHPNGTRDFVPIIA